jgi:hypothetical protein
MKKETDEIHNLVFFKNICFIFLEGEGGLEGEREREMGVNCFC